MPLRPIGHRDDDHDAADASVRDERLRAVDHPARRPGATAVVRIPAASLPALASVRPQAPSTSPRTSRGRYGAFWRSSPNIAMCDAQSPLCAATDSAIAGTDARDLFDADAVVHRRHRRRRRTLPGTGCRSARGRRASAAAPSGTCCASSHSITCGRISASANSRTVRRRSSCSSVGRKSIARECITGARSAGDVHPAPLDVHRCFSSSAFCGILVPTAARRRHRVSRRQPDAHQSRRQGLRDRHRPRDRRLRVRVREQQRGHLARARRRCGRSCSTASCRRRYQSRGMQFYGTAGGGVYRETLERACRRRTSGSTSVAA